MENHVENLCFTDYRLEIRRYGDGEPKRKLFKSGGRKQGEKIRPKALQVLEYLIRHCGEELPREDIHKAIWGDENDGGGDLDTHIRLIRKIFSDDPKKPQFIRTIRDHGFCFMPLVTPCENWPPKSVATTFTPADAPQSPQRDKAVTVKVTAENGIDDDEIEDFFGDGALSSGPNVHPGVIVLQSDPIEELLAELVPDLIFAGLERLKEHLQVTMPTPEVKAEILKKAFGKTAKEAKAVAEALAEQAIRPATRFYKARNWINAFDVAGARWLVKELERHRVAVEIVFPDHTPPTQIHTPVNHFEFAPFQIAMGLGYTDLTLKILNSESFKPWVSIRRTETAGDSVLFDERLRNSLSGECLTDPAEPQPNGFFRLLPFGWTDDYLYEWKDMREKDVHDYAFILRHTDFTEHRRQISFVIAGFTERGTAAGGFHLAARFPEIYRSVKTTYKDSQRYKKSRGDFLLVVQGLSRSDKFRAWKPAFPAITPQTLQNAAIPCEWARRMDAEIQRD